MMRRILNAQGPLIHIIAGLLAPVWFYSWTGQPALVEVLVLAAVAALLPDIDSQASWLGRLCPALSRPLEQRFGHRQLTHSLLAVAVIGGVAWGVFGASGWLLTAAYFSHLVVDMLVGFIGIPLLWPLQTRFYLVRLRPMSFQESGLGLLLGCLLLLPLRPEGRSFTDSLVPKEDLAIQPTTTPTAMATPTATATPHVVVITIANVYDLEREILVQVGETITQGQLVANLATQRQLLLPTATATATAVPPDQLPSPTPWPTVNPFVLQAIQNDLELAQANYHHVIATGTPNPTYVARLAAFPPQLQERRDCVAREGLASDPGWRCQQELQQLEAEMAHWAALAQPSQPDPLLVQIARQRYDSAVIAYNQQIAALTPPPTATVTPIPTVTAPSVAPTPPLSPAPLLPNDPTAVRALISGQVVAIDIATIRGNAATIDIHILLSTPSLAAPRLIPLPPTPPAPQLLSPSAPSLPTALLPVTLQRVIDGDTLVVAREDGRSETVRLLGIDTPETVYPGRATACYGPEAAQFVATALPPGKSLWLELDEQTGERDHYGRLLAHLWLTDGGDGEANGRLFNLNLLNLGYAIHNDYGNPSRYSDLYTAAAIAAQQSGVGLWAACPQE